MLPLMLVHRLNAFTDNYIWLLEIANSEVIIIDPGECESIVSLIEARQLKPVAVLLTHYDYDHIAGLADLVTHYPIPVYGSPTHPPKPLTHDVSHGQKLLIGGFPAIQVMETPGHKPEHICYLIEDKLFCGDTLFSAGCGRVRNNQHQEMFQSLSLLKQLPANTEIYCSHEYTQNNLHFASTVEPNNTDIQRRINTANECIDAGEATLPSLLSEELLTNPFLRTDKASVKKMAEQYVDHFLDSEQAIFKVLRDWKDSF